ncbi:hypothetical protein CEXT_126901 [Caerostris extrusa]|uniref:Uncharacterized protein n=1 Tax=Caerostris extrusa TaxID=172846 RepID=A0AAV4VB43_CAEEX|nr:hypothetical protein CEXT_126901 [Caerostris extrusa]
MLLTNVGSDDDPILIELDYDAKACGNNNIYWNFKKVNWTLFEKNLIEQLQKNPITEDLENECAARVITGLRPSCPNDSVCYEADLQPLSLRREMNIANNITFNEDLKVKFIKHQEHPELLRQLALEIINNISPRPCFFTLTEANLTLEEQSQKKYDNAVMKIALNAISSCKSEHISVPLRVPKMQLVTCALD